MMPDVARSVGTFAGTRWLLGGVSVILIALLSLWLLSAMRRIETVVERMIVEQTVQNIRTGLKVAMSEAVISQRDGEIAGWVGENPVRWLASPPNGYRGECARGDDVGEGVWCFERTSGDLVYRPRYAEGLVAKDGRALSVLRWRVGMTKGIRTDESVAWLRVENVTSYVWVIE